MSCASFEAEHQPHSKPIIGADTGSRQRADKGRTGRGSVLNTPRVKKKITAEVFSGGMMSLGGYLVNSADNPGTPPVRGPRPELFLHVVCSMRE